MRRILHRSGVASALLVSAVSIAPAAAQNFGGASLGASIGYGSGASRWASAGFSAFDTTGRGAVGGINAGYNVQTGSAVIGAEVDYLFTSLKGNVDCPGSGGTLACASEARGLGSLRARLGWAFMPSAMVYFTGGLAWGNTQWSATDKANPANRISVSGSSTGYALGGGVDFLMSQNWILRAEYLHYELGSRSYRAGELADVNIELRPKADVFKLGVNYRF